MDAIGRRTRGRPFLKGLRNSSVSSFAANTHVVFEMQSRKAFERETSQEFRSRARSKQREAGLSIPRNVGGM